MFVSIGRKTTVRTIISSINTRLAIAIGIDSHLGEEEQNGEREETKERWFGCHLIPE